MERVSDLSRSQHPNSEDVLNISSSVGSKGLPKPQNKSSCQRLSRVKDSGPTLSETHLVPIKRGCGTYYLGIVAFLNVQDTPRSDTALTH